MITKEIKNCSLKQIAESGQAFRWKQLDEAGNKYSIIAYSNYVEVEQSGDKFTFNCSEKDYYILWHRYFDVDTDYGKIIETADKSDVLLQNALKCGNGIRILQQDTWEVFITFIISQNNRIGRIKNTIERMCERMGERCGRCTLEQDAEKITIKVDDSIMFYAFPKPEALTDIEALQGLGLGYRNKYIVAAATAVQKCILNLQQLRFTDHEQALTILKNFKGIGNKVAECICLFGLHQLEAYPVDTWVKKIERYYGAGYIEKQYSGFQGVIQQYLFSYVRLHGIAEREGLNEKETTKETNDAGG